LVIFHKKFNPKILYPGIILSLLLITVLSGCGGSNSTSSGGMFSIWRSVGGGLTFPTDKDTTTLINNTVYETVTPPSPPTILGDPGSPSITVTVKKGLWIANSAVTYELWNTVYKWAIDPDRGTEQYFHLAPGLKGSSGGGSEQQPVTNISWRDAIVWCNALTEYYNAHFKYGLECSYIDSKKQVIRDPNSVDASSNNICDSMTDFDHDHNGFRLPTSNEWELAARYIDGKKWTPGDYASGASANYNDLSATNAVAVYNALSTAIVKSKAANALDLYDMSGNVWQWCFDLYPGSTSRIRRGGSWKTAASNLQISLGDIGSDTSTDVQNDMGFRPVRYQ
jgi:formylglycine-generating enzyme required for sulfatase activity